MLSDREHQILRDIEARLTDEDSELVESMTEHHRPRGERVGYAVVIVIAVLSGVVCIVVAALAGAVVAFVFAAVVFLLRWWRFPARRQPPRDKT